MDYRKGNITTREINERIRRIKLYYIRKVAYQVEFRNENGARGKKELEEINQKYRVNDTRDKMRLVKPDGEITEQGEVMIANGDVPDSEIILKMFLISPSIKCDQEPIFYVNALRGLARERT